MKSNRERAIAFGEMIPALCLMFGCTHLTAYTIAAIWFDAVEKGKFGD